ncbi:Vascular endothelial growth factor receptor 1, partial [Dufourea novaeangliae]
VDIHKIDSYYAPDQEVEMYCTVSTHPVPEITWSFLRCPNYPVCKNGTKEILTRTNKHEYTYYYKSSVKMTIEMSGKLTCTACTLGLCESDTAEIRVSDGNDIFGIIAPKEPVIEGDDFELICAASVYNYLNILTWEKNSSSFKNKRLSIVRNQTQFTYRSTLKIENVDKQDSGRYVCFGTTKENITGSTEYNLEVWGTPSFNSTNLNQNENVIDLNTLGDEPVILKCFANVMAKLNITWYKDGTMLGTNEQFMFLQNNQELHIKYLLESDSGNYSCRLENPSGRLESYLRITVKGRKDLPKKLIILIVILVIVVMILVIHFTINIRRGSVSSILSIMYVEMLHEAELIHFKEGAVEWLNPDLTVDGQMELLPYDKKWEFPRERLTLGKILGRGVFGIVMKAKAIGIRQNEVVTIVAVKMVRRKTDSKHICALASELKIMAHLGKHLNIVNLLGACANNISHHELLVIVEYCRFGNLHNYLLRHRGYFINQINPSTDKFDSRIGIDILTRTVGVGSNNSVSENSSTDSVHNQSTATDSQGVRTSQDGSVLSSNTFQTGWRSNYCGDDQDHNLKPIYNQDLLSWAFQVARGMEYLCQRKAVPFAKYLYVKDVSFNSASYKVFYEEVPEYSLTFLIVTKIYEEVTNVLHGDLAARNILLADNNVVKICDFGLAKNMYKYGNYKKKSDDPLPIKWMAIESIRDQIFSTQSDIWSFGIVLWEFFTLAETPYPGMEGEKLYQKLIEGYRMEQPEYATSKLYNIMVQCWTEKPVLRPSSTELVESIGDLLEESVRAHYVSLNDPYMDMNTTMLAGGKKDYLTMLSAPDFTLQSSLADEHVHSSVLENPGDSLISESTFSPRLHQGRTHFVCSSQTSVSENAVGLSPMLKKEEDDDFWLKPIPPKNWQAAKNQMPDQSTDRNSRYCNMLMNRRISEGIKDNVDSVDRNNFGSPIITTEKMCSCVLYRESSISMSRLLYNECDDVISTTAEGGRGTSQAHHFLPSTPLRLPFHEPTAERGGPGSGRAGQLVLMLLWWCRSRWYTPRSEVVSFEAAGMPAGDVGAPRERLSGNPYDCRCPRFPRLGVCRPCIRSHARPDPPGSSSG